MVKAAALYIVIIISLVIAIISASLLSVAFYYRLEIQKKNRLDRLNTNLQSGTALILSDDYKFFDQELQKDLYGDEKDSLSLNKMQWGVFEVNTVKAYTLKDTLKRAFFSGNNFRDSSVIYLAEENRPLSISGNTQLTGDAELPKSGLKQAYVDGKPYAGKELIKGAVKNSTLELPQLDEKQIANLLKYFNTTGGMSLSVKNELKNSFFNPVQVYRLKAGPGTISGMKIKGKVVLISDSTLTIDRDMQLEDVLVYAPVIMVADGFKGTCQLFARDSISIGKKCELTYPSFAGVFKRDTSKVQPKISLGRNSSFSGILLSYERERSVLQTKITIGKDAKVQGEIYAVGYIEFEPPVTVYGKLYTKRFVIKRNEVLYENYLIDVVLNRKLLSKYYLSSELLGRKEQGNQILKWLN